MTLDLIFNATPNRSTELVMGNGSYSRGSMSLIPLDLLVTLHRVLFCCQNKRKNNAFIASPPKQHCFSYSYFAHSATASLNKCLANANRPCDCRVLCLCLKSSLCSCAHSISDTTSFGCRDQGRDSVYPVL